jgi:outer membrane protein TolC
MNKIKYPLALTAFLMAFLPALSLAAQEDSLAHYLSVAAANNPSLRAARLTFEAAQQKIPQAGAYADPTLEMGAFIEPMEYAGGRQIAQFQLMQMFPWFGSRKAARTEARHMSQMAFEQFREARDNVFMEVYTQWYALCALKQKLLNSRENRAWLEQLEQLALRRYTSPPGTSPQPPPKEGETTSPQPPPKEGGMNMGGGMTAGGATSGGMSSGMAMGGNSFSPSLGGGGGEVGLGEVFSVQLSIMEIESAMESLRAEIAAQKARFNTLLNRPAASEIALPDSIERLPFRPDRERILSEIAERNPMLGMYRQESLAWEAKAEMDRKMGYPMFGVGLQYMLMAPLPAAAPASSGMDDGMNAPAPMAMNGKDMLMPMLSLSIPLYRSKYKAAQRESRLLQQAGEAKQADAFNRLEAELHRAIYLLDDAERKIDLYRRQSALAHTTATLSTQEFISGKADLSSVIQIHRQLLDYRLREAEAVAAYNTAVAAIQKLASFLNIEQKTI